MINIMNKFYLYSIAIALVAILLFMMYLSQDDLPVIVDFFALFLFTGLGALINDLYRRGKKEGQE